MRMLLLDVDHTVACAGWRDGLMGEWDEYHSMSCHDNPIEAMIELVQSLHRDGWYICGLTARPEKWRKLTVEWLVKHDVPYDYLAMRSEYDYSKSSDMKIAMFEYLAHCGMYDGDDIIILIDDRPDIIAAFSAIGVASLQVHARSNKSSPITSGIENG